MDTGKPKSLSYIYTHTYIFICMYVCIYMIPLQVGMLGYVQFISEYCLVRSSPWLSACMPLLSILLFSLSSTVPYTGGYPGPQPSLKHSLVSVLSGALPHLVHTEPSLWLPPLSRFFICHEHVRLPSPQTSKAFEAEHRNPHDCLPALRG